MCKPNGEAGHPGTSARRGDCRGCPICLQPWREERITARLDALVKERPPPASDFLQTHLRF